MKKFTKQFNNFEEGIKELAKVSFSAEQALKWQNYELPLTEAEAVKNLALNVAFDRPTANGVDWSNTEIEITAFGVSYKTTGGLRFGWGTVLGANDFDSFEGKYMFYVAHPFADDDSAAPAESTLRKSAEESGWKEVDADVFALASYAKF